jgi:polysaccharide deacetylase 2 family uncharacterized protein YibQ
MRRHPHRAGGFGWPGVGLFLLGAATGAGGSYFACRDSPAWRPGAEQARSAAESPAEAKRPGRHQQSGQRGQGDHSGQGGQSDQGGGRAGVAAGAAGAAQPIGATGGVGEAAPEPVPRLPPQATRIALVIDDLGRSLGELETLSRLGIPLTYAVLPFERETSEVAAALRRRGEEILCHLPMEPASGGDPGPGALRLGMSAEELRASTLAAIVAVPGAVGVNNHMGSGLSANPASMGTILGVVAARRLYFLDSRTSPRSVGFQVASELGVPAAERQVFLDDDQRPQAIAAQFERLLELARSRGEAIAIGHPHPATLATLAVEVPKATALGYRFVQVSALLERSGRRP